MYHCVACQTLSCWTFLGHLEMLTMGNWDKWLCYPHNCSDLFGAPSSHSRSWILTSMCLFAVQRMAKHLVMSWTHAIDAGGVCGWLQGSKIGLLRKNAATYGATQRSITTYWMGWEVERLSRYSDWHDVAFCRSWRRSWVGSVNRRHEFQYRHV